MSKYISTDDIQEKVLPITYVRNNLGKIISSLDNNDSILVSKGSKIVAEIKPKKRKAKTKYMTTGEKLMRFGGMWKGTPLDDDKLWDSILTHDSSDSPKL